MEKEKVDNSELTEMLQLKAIYGLTTLLAEQCFPKCLGNDGINRKLENDQKQCIVSCAVNYLTVKMLSTKKLLSLQNQVKD